MELLRQNVELLEVPESYENGLIVEDSLIPQNIVMFQRHDFIMHRSMNVHNRYMLIIALAGEGTIFVDNQLRTLSTGQGTLVFPFQTHYYLETSDDYHFLFITFELPHGSFSTLKSGLFSIDDYFGLLAQLVDYYQNSKSSHAAVNFISMGIGMILNDLVFRSQTIDAPVEIDKEKLLLTKIVQYIYDNLHSNLKACEIAESVALSPSHMQRCFKEAMGVSLGRFIKSAKLNEAQHLLAATKMTVSEIVYKCGYESVPSFCNAFKRFTGMSPREFRKKH